MGGRPAPFRCDAALDLNGDDALDLTDPIVTLLYLFRSGESPAAPFPACGLDARPQATGASCQESSCR